MNGCSPVTSETARRLFAERVLPHLDDAYGFARWLTGDAADAEDVVQDACLRALRAIEQAQGSQSSRAWLFVIVRNAAFTWMARNRRKDVVASDELDGVEDLSQPSPESSVIARADAESLQRAIDALPLAYREALVMREFSDMSYREIAEATGAPVGTVMSRLARARALLMASMRDSAP